MESSPAIVQSVGFVHSREMLDKLMEVVAADQNTFGKFTQEQVDRIFSAGAIAANQARVKLAQLAVEEGGMGLVEDKSVKNHFSAEYVHNTYKDMKTCGVVERDEAGGFIKYAEPIGVLAGIVPCTNPTSTTIFKSLLALKTRNCIVFSPHPRTAKCTIEAAKVVRDAAVAEGMCLAPVVVITVFSPNSRSRSRNGNSDTGFILEPAFRQIIVVAPLTNELYHYLYLLFCFYPSIVLSLNTCLLSATFYILVLSLVY